MTCAAQSELSHALEDFPHSRLYVTCAVQSQLRSALHKPSVTRTVRLSHVLQSPSYRLCFIQTLSVTHHRARLHVLCSRWLPSVTQLLCHVCCHNPVTACPRQKFPEILFHFIMVMLRAGCPKNRGLISRQVQRFLLLIREAQTGYLCPPSVIFNPLAPELFFFNFSTSCI